MKVLIGYDGSESADFKSGFESFRLGSVSTAVVTNAHCSVEIVRPPETTHE